MTSNDIGMEMNDGEGIAANKYCTSRNHKNQSQDENVGPQSLAELRAHVHRFSIPLYAQLYSEQQRHPLCALYGVLATHPYSLSIFPQKQWTKDEHKSNNPINPKNIRKETKLTQDTQTQPQNTQEPYHPSHTPTWHT